MTNNLQVKYEGNHRWTEALQLFPAESRVVDTANQYHLFVFMLSGRDKFPMIPVGWTEGQRTDKQIAKSKQRPGAESARG